VARNGQGPARGSGTTAATALTLVGCDASARRPRGAAPFNGRFAASKSRFLLAWFWRRVEQVKRMLVDATR